MTVQGDGFPNVDRAADPQLLVNYLDTVSGAAEAQAFKRRSFEIMGARPGAQVLDIGCGTGDDVRALGHIVGPQGRAVGVDSSETMIAEARKRSDAMQLPAEFYAGSIYHLDFPDNTFDSSRAERVFIHLDDSRKALSEMMRVVKPGGHLLVDDPDWETLVVDASDRAVTRKIANYKCDRTMNGWSGRQLVGLFKQLGLHDVEVEAGTFVSTDYALAVQVLSLQRDAERARDDGLVSADQAAQWLNDLEQRAAAGRFFCAVTGFTVSGRKPPRGS